MEQIIGKLLVGDSKVIQQGTIELKEAFKKPEAITALCDILVSSSSPQFRQTAAVILRRKLAKKNQWSKVDLQTRNRIKAGMIQALVNEQEKLVKNAIAQFIGLLGKHEFPNNTWPEVLQFIHQLCNSDNVIDKELGMYTLSIMTEISKGTYIEHAEVLGALFTNILNGLPDLSSNLAYYTVLTMSHLVSVIGGHQRMINVYHNLLPRVLEIINMFAQQDERKACELFEIIDDLIEYAVAVVVPHICLVIEMCLQIGANKERETSVQIKAIGVVGWLIRCKSKVVQKFKLIEPIIEVVLQLMAQKPDDDVNEEYFEGDPDQFTSTTIAAQTLDVIAIHVPPEKVVPFLLTRIEPALQGNDIYSQKAAYLALAVLAEGCADHIRSKYLESFLKCIYNGIRSPNVVVRNAAFFALGQFAEHLQPEISQYAAELLPVFFDYLSQLYSDMEKSRIEPSGLDRMFYALQSFCMHLDDGLLPYLPTLMDRLMVALDSSSWSLQLKKLALSTLDSVACAVKDKLPYFDKLIVILNLYITADQKGELNELQPYAIECLASILENVDMETSKPLAGQILQMALSILEDNDDPDIKKSLYNLFSALSHVMKEEMTPALPKIIEEMMKTIQSSEGIIALYDDEEKDGLDIYQELSDSDADEEDIDHESESSDESQCRYTVENSFTDEKEQACISITFMCKNLGHAFLPYVNQSFEEIFKLVNYPHEDIRSAAIYALKQFCITLHSVDLPESKAALYKALQIFVPKCAELIRCDEEQNIVMSAINVYADLLEELKADVLVGEGHREAIMNCVFDILTHKTVCQDQDVAGEIGEDEEESEQTETLLQCAGDVIPKFGNSLTPDDFVCYFPNVLQLLTMRAKNKSVCQRSFVYGILAECMKPLSIYVEKFVPALMPLWVAGAKDSDDGVRNNAVFGVGEMILHGKDCIFPHYTNLIQGLSELLAKESHAGTVDNICGAIAKMIISNSSLFDLGQVLNVLLIHLPLKTDFQENESVIKCFFGLYRQGNPVFKEKLEDVIKIVVHIYHHKQTGNTETETLVNEFLKTVNADFPQEFGTIVSSLGPEVMQNVQKLFS